MKKLKLSNDTDDVYSILDSTLFSKTKKKSLYDGFKKNKTILKSTKLTTSTFIGVSFLVTSIMPLIEWLKFLHKLNFLPLFVSKVSSFSFSRSCNIKLFSVFCYGSSNHINLKMLFGNTDNFLIT